MPVSDLLVLVTGTATEIGKTWAAARLATGLRAAGHPVAARKPVMSYAPGEEPTDAQVLAEATEDDELDICPSHRRYELAMAPPMAADALGRPPILIEDLVKELALPRTGIVLIEGVGGVRSPMAHDGDALSVAGRLHPDLLLLVAPAGLGAINDLLTSLDSIAYKWPVLVFLNRFDERDEIHRANLEWLRAALPIDIAVSIPEMVARVLPTPRNNLGASPPPLEVT